MEQQEVKRVVQGHTGIGIFRDREDVSTQIPPSSLHAPSGAKIAPLSVISSFILWFSLPLPMALECLGWLSICGRIHRSLLPSDVINLSSTAESLNLHVG